MNGTTDTLAMLATTIEEAAQKRAEGDARSAVSKAREAYAVVWTGVPDDKRRTAVQAAFATIEEYLIEAYRIKHINTLRNRINEAARNALRGIGE